MSESPASDVVTHSEPRTRQPETFDRAVGRICLMCPRSLDPGERKVHAVDCARRRQVHLRRLARARSRR